MKKKKQTNTIYYCIINGCNKRAYFRTLNKYRPKYCIDHSVKNTFNYKRKKCIIKLCARNICNQDDYCRHHRYIHTNAEKSKAKNKNTAAKKVDSICDAIVSADEIFSGYNIESCIIHVNDEELRDEFLLDYLFPLSDCDASAISMISEQDTNSLAPQFDLNASAHN